MNNVVHSAKTFKKSGGKNKWHYSCDIVILIIIQTFTKVIFWHLDGLLKTLLTKNQQKRNDEEVLRFGMIMSVKIR